MVPFRVLSTYTEALVGTLSRIRTPVAWGVTVVLTITTRGFMITDGGAVVITGLIDMECINGSGILPIGPIISPAKAETGNKRRSINEPIRRPESAFMYSPEEQGTAGIPGYMPFTSHSLKPIDVYLWYSNLARSGERIACFYTAAIRPATKEWKMGVPRSNPIPFYAFFPPVLGSGIFIKT